MAAPRIPWLAFLISLLSPGIGHLYAGVERLPIWAPIAAWIGAIAALILALTMPVKPLNAIVAWMLPLVTLLLIAASAAGKARRAPQPFQPTRYNSWYWYVGWVVGTGLILNFVILPLMHADVGEAIRIPSHSMEPTILVGDLLYIRKWPRPPTGIKRGELIVFTSVEEPDLKVLKRVVGTPGDTIAMESGNLLLNGEPLAEPYVEHGDPTKTEEMPQRDRMRIWQLPHLVIGDSTWYHPDVSNWGPIVVSPESLFVLGDNREQSYDSRYYGFVPLKSVVGSPRVVYASVAPSSPDGGSFFHRIRWERIGTQF